MKKKYYLAIVYILFVIILSISIYKAFEPQKLGKIYSSLYQSLDYYINKIDTNMDEITTSDDNLDWAKLKETNLKDEHLKTAYKLLISDIRTCYLLSNDLKNKTYDNIKILNFKNKTSITEKELSELNENDNCLEKFDKYNSLVLSDDQELSEKTKKKISIIIDYKPEPYIYETFGGLLNKESITISKVASLTDWLKVEYYSHKKS